MKKPFPLITFVVTVLLILVLFMRFHLVLTRYIDPDEFAHLHWSFLLSTGIFPYRDFFMNFTPLYHWTLSPIFLLPHASTTVVIARTIQYLLYIATVAIVYILALRVLKNHVRAMIAILIFTTFPMTLDKTLELRPDILMTLLFLGSFVLLLSPSSLTKTRAALAGVLIGASFMVLLKIAFALPALFYLATQTFLTRRKYIPWFLAGLAAFPFFFFLYGFILRLLPQAFENIVRGSTFLKAGEGAFSPWKSLSPYPLVYVERGGASFPWFVNTFLFGFSLFGLILLWRRTKVAAITFALSLLGGAIFLYAFPTPYLQYFIPISAIVCIPAAFALTWAVQRLKHPILTKALLVVVMLALGTSFFIQYRLRTGPNSEITEQLGVIDSVLAVSKPDETFYDMVGSYVFRPDGHYICCNIYSQFAQFLTPKPPTLAESLVSRKTKFVILDRAGKVFWHPTAEDLTFLMAHYVPSSLNKKIYVVGSRFRCTFGQCLQLNVHGEPISRASVDSFEIVIEEEYRIVTEPKELPVMINRVRALEAMELSPGLYRFSVPPEVTTFTVELNRS